MTPAPFKVAYVGVTTVNTKGVPTNTGVEAFSIAVSHAFVWAVPVAAMVFA